MFLHNTPKTKKIFLDGNICLCIKTYINTQYIKIILNICCTARKILSIILSTPPLRHIWRLYCYKNILQ